ncbi:hypothetical protein ECOLI_50178 [Escherichia coli]|nr:hypothetical protein ECOLI_50178 [Escherichia coli]
MCKYSLTIVSVFLHTVAPDMFSSAKRELNGRNIIHYKFKRGISKLLGQEIICKNQEFINFNHGFSIDVGAYV